MISNGELVNSIPRKYLPGESVDYRCHEGFEFRGSHSAICENMEWSQVPACEGMNASSASLTVVPMDSQWGAFHGAAGLQSYAVKSTQ